MTMMFTSCHERYTEDPKDKDAMDRRDKLEENAKRTTDWQLYEGVTSHLEVTAEQKNVTGH